MVSWGVRKWGQREPWSCDFWQQHQLHLTQNLRRGSPSANREEPFQRRCLGGELVSGVLEYIRQPLITSPGPQPPFPIRSHHQISCPQRLAVQDFKAQSRKASLETTPQITYATPALLEGFLQPSTPSCFACGEVQVAAWTRTGLAAVLGDRPFAFYFIDGIQNISPS